MPRVIALTGATGFIGTALVKRLRSAGYHLRAFYRGNGAGRHDGSDQTLRWVQGRLDDPESLAQLLSGCDTVIHGAGVVRGSEWRHFEKVNTDGVARMVQAARLMHPSPRFLLLSSLTAREPQLSHYAASKRLGEKALESDGGALEWAVLRPPAVYGPGDREISPLFRWMCRGLAPQASSRASKFSMLYINDLADAIVALLEKEQWHRSTFELHDGHPGGYDWGEVVQTVSRVAARNILRFKLPRPMIRTAAAVNLGAARVCGYAPMLTPGKVRELEHPDWTCDNAVFSKATGWQPCTDLAEGIRKTLVYLKIIADKANRTTRGTQHADV